LMTDTPPAGGEGGATTPQETGKGGDATVTNQGGAKIIHDSKGGPDPWQKKEKTTEPEKTGENTVKMMLFKDVDPANGECHEAEFWSVRLVEWKDLCDGLVKNTLALCPGNTCNFDDKLPDFPETALIEKIPQAQKFRDIFKEEIEKWVPKVQPKLDSMGECLLKHYQQLLNMDTGPYAELCRSMDGASTKMTKAKEDKVEKLEQVLEIIMPVRQMVTRMIATKPDNQVTLDSQLARKCTEHDVLDCKIDLEDINSYSPPCDKPAFKDIVDEYDKSVQEKCAAHPKKEDPLLSHHQRLKDYVKKLQEFFNEFAEFTARRADEIKKTVATGGEATEVETKHK